jgi:hypothetical protein
MSVHSCSSSSQAILFSASSAARPIQPGSCLIQRTLGGAAHSEGDVTLTGVSQAGKLTGTGVSRMRVRHRQRPAPTFEALSAS